MSLESSWGFLNMEKTHTRFDVGFSTNQQMKSLHTECLRYPPHRTASPDIIFKLLRRLPKIITHIAPLTQSVLIRTNLAPQQSNWSCDTNSTGTNLGHAVAQWLRHCAKRRKVAGPIPDGCHFNSNSLLSV
jgi:hypothetical protein